MLAIIALILFAIGWIFHGFGFSPNAWLSWPSFLLLGLVFLAWHLIPRFTNWTFVRR